MRMRPLLGAVIVLLAAHGASAAPIVGVSANMLPRGKFMLDTWFSWRDYTRAWDDGLYAEGGGWIDLPDGTVITAGSFVPRLYYGATDWLTVRVAVPLEDRLTDLGDSADEESNTGLGDIVIDPKIQIYRSPSGYPRVALLAGIQFPTGDSTGSPAISDGSTDFVVGGVVTHEIGAVTAHAYVTYWLNGESEAGVDVKDVWVGCGTLETRVSDSWSLLWELKAYFGEERTEYYRVYACPGVAWNDERLTIGVSSLIPAAAHGGGGVSWVDFTWAPYIQVTYRFF